MNVSSPSVVVMMTIVSAFTLGSAIVHACAIVSARRVPREDREHLLRPLVGRRHVRRRRLNVVELARDQRRCGVERVRRAERIRLRARHADADLRARSNCTSRSVILPVPSYMISVSDLRKCCMLATGELLVRKDLRESRATTGVRRLGEVLATRRQQRTIRRIAVRASERHRRANELRRRARQIGRRQHAAHAAEIAKARRRGRLHRSRRRSRATTAASGSTDAGEPHAASRRHPTAMRMGAAS